MKQLLITILQIFLFLQLLQAQEYHVSPKGNDFSEGSKDAPFKTINYAAKIAQAGDTVTVHEGIYRESVNPINGGTSAIDRILYRAAPGEKVVIKGSEIVVDWTKHTDSVWKVVIPNAFFNNYNPFKDELEGDWLDKKSINHHTGEVFLNGKPLFEKNNIREVLASRPYPDARDQLASTYTWHAKVDTEKTTIWANFQDFDPNEEVVEINARPYCFYPENPGVDYITVRGFTMSQAATQWAAPTAEQVGLIGTHWSKGWIIEDNVISNSKCVGITLGKERSTGHNVWSKNPEKDGATIYNEVIFKAYYNAGWSKENIGSHIVRNNEVFQCGQAGIVGSLGAVFSEISNNHIHDIWSRRIVDGYEMAGIKIHAPIDMFIANNRIHNTGRGMWLDWMAQGTRVSNNLFYDNTTDDLFMEVNHGPYLIENNIFLSEVAIKDWSEGGAFVHNLISGQIQTRVIKNRSTPYHFPHSTKVFGVKDIDGGDNRYFNNLFIKNGEREETIDTLNANRYANFYGLDGYKITKLPNKANGNIYYNGAKPLIDGHDEVEHSSFKPSLKIEENGNGIFIELILDNAILKSKIQVVTSELLGKTFISEAMFENFDGRPYHLNQDFFGGKRNVDNLPPGPFQNLKVGKNYFRVW